MNESLATADPGLVLARRMAGVRPSAIRNLQARSSRHDVVSMGGGRPDAAAIPRDWLADCFAEALKEPHALQYAGTEGDLGLRTVVAAWEQEWSGRPISPDDVLITTGSQQALSLLATALVDPGDRVVVEEPAYTGALGAFRLLEPELVAVPHDTQGIEVELLTEKLAAGLRPKLVYVAPTFQNPDSTTLPVDRRQRLAELADRYGFWLVDDDAYRSLWFGSPPPPPLTTFGTHVVRLGSFSKILSPGLRVGWIVAPPELRQALIRVKESADLHTTTIAQIALRKAAEDHERLADHLAQVRELYSARARLLLGSLQRGFGTAVSAVAPEGGMFCWVRFTDGTDTSVLLPPAVEEGVTFVPGRAFSVSADLGEAARLCFASVTTAQIPQGIDRLASAHSRLK